MPSRLRYHDEFGHIHFLTISCHRRLRFFRHDSVKLAMIAAMKRIRDKHRLRWFGYVIMPEHVHVPDSYGESLNSLSAPSSTGNAG